MSQTEMRGLVADGIRYGGDRRVLADVVDGLQVRAPRTAPAPEGTYQSVPQFWMEDSPIRDAFKGLTKAFGEDPVGVTFGCVGLLMSAVLPLVGAIAGYFSITHVRTEISVKLCETGLNKSVFGSLASGTGGYVFRAITWSAPIIPFAMILVSSTVTGCRNYRDEMAEERLDDDGQKLQYTLSERVSILADHVKSAIAEEMPWKRLAYTAAIVVLTVFVGPLAALSPLAKVLGEGLAMEVVTQTALGIARAVSGSVHVDGDSTAARYTAPGLKGLVGVASCVLLSHSTHYCYLAGDTSHAILWTGTIAIGATAIAAALAALSNEDGEYRAWNESRRAHARPISNVLFTSPVGSAYYR